MLDVRITRREIDFLGQNKGQIEVEPEENLHLKSPRAFSEKHQSIHLRHFSYQDLEAKAE